MLLFVQLLDTTAAVDVPATKYKDTVQNSQAAIPSSVDILSVDISSVDIVHVPGASHVTGTGSAICGTSACLGLGTPAAASSHTTHNVWRNISWSRQV